MDRKISIVTIALDALLEAERFAAIVLLDQLEKDSIELVCYSRKSLASTKQLLRQEQLHSYFDAINRTKPTHGIFITKASQVSYPAVMLTAGARRARLPIAVMLNLYAVEPLTKDAILDGKIKQS